jgi:hypothetical protein
MRSESTSLGEVKKMQNSFQQFFAKALVGAAAVVTATALFVGIGGVSGALPAKPSTLLELGIVFMLAAIYFVLDEMRLSK